MHRTWSAGAQRTCPGCCKSSKLLAPPPQHHPLLQRKMSDFQSCTPVFLHYPARLLTIFASKYWSAYWKDGFPLTVLMCYFAFTIPEFIIGLTHRAVCCNQSERGCSVLIQSSVKPIPILIWLTWLFPRLPAVTRFPALACGNWCFLQADWSMMLFRGVVITVTVTLLSFYDSDVKSALNKKYITLSVFLKNCENTSGSVELREMLRAVSTSPKPSLVFLSIV